MNKNFDDSSGLLHQIGPTRIHVHADPVRGNIVRHTTDVLVSSEGTDASMTGGVSGEILKEGGKSILASLRAHQPIVPGQVVITSAGALSPPVKNIYHAVVVGWSDEQLVFQATIWRVVNRCVQLAQLTGMSSLTFPSLGTGSGEADILETHTTMAASCIEALDSQSSLREIHFCFIKPEHGDLFRRAFLQQRLLQNAQGIASRDATERSELTKMLDDFLPQFLGLTSDIGETLQVVRLLEKRPTAKVIKQYISQHISTAGGTYIEGDIHMEGGDFLG